MNTPAEIRIAIRQQAPSADDLPSFENAILLIPSHEVQSGTVHVRACRFVGFLARCMIFLLLMGIQVPKRHLCTRQKPALSQDQ